MLSPKFDVTPRAQDSRAVMHSASPYLPGPHPSTIVKRVYELCNDAAHPGTRPSQPNSVLSASFISSTHTHTPAASAGGR